MTYKYILFSALGFTLGTVASAWNNVSRTQFKSIVEENDLTLVACKFPAHLAIASSHSVVRMSCYQICKIVVTKSHSCRGMPSTLPASNEEPLANHKTGGSSHGRE